MKKEAFDTGMARLSLAFEHRVKSELADLIYEEIAGWTSADWQTALKALISDPHRRHFPRIGEMKAALSDASAKRFQIETEHRQRLEGDLEGTGDILKRIPFPHDLKAALWAKMDGKMTQAQLEDYCRVWEEKAEGA